ncbi:MAG: hypothetical protein ACP5O2_10390 [Bacteroidales bacterium]
MEENNPIMESGDEGRRNFLKKLGIVAGVGVAAAAGAVYVASDYEERKNPEGKKVRVLTADGQLVEVP